MNTSILNKTFCLDLSSSVSYKEKKNIIDLITCNGGNVSFILNNKCSYLVKNDKNSNDSYKSRLAYKLSIPVIHVDYFFHYINDFNTNYKLYLIEDKLNEINFKQGKVSKSKKTIKLEEKK